MTFRFLYQLDSSLLLSSDMYTGAQQSGSSPSSPCWYTTDTMILKSLIIYLSTDFMKIRMRRLLLLMNREEISCYIIGTSKSKNIQLLRYFNLMELLIIWNTCKYATKVVLFLLNT